ncbi:ATP-binding protein [Magnetospirillum moscoviense]|uniref:ATP-binding protein n=1 Tax=Magnetospirillum moscoviense TaxID=1437059 RepID=UPI0009ED8107|nr:ATP-binding protein [Magnetospirillum moscoviense]
MKSGLPGRDWFWAPLVVLLTLTMVVWDVFHIYASRRADTRERLEALARVVEARTHQVFLGIDRMLADAGTELAMAGPPGAPAFHRYLTARAKIHAEALTITVVAPDGTILHSSAANLVGKNVGDRSYLAYFRENPKDDGLFIGEPVKGLLNRTIVFAARGIDDDDGKLKAVVVSAISPAIFAGMLDAALPSEPSGAISLSNRHHIILARAPDLDGDAVGLSLAQAPAMVAHIASGKPASLQEATGGVDGVRRMVAIRTVEPWGLTIGVTASIADILKPALARILGDFVLLGVIIFITIALVRVSRSRERARHQAHESLAQARDYYMRVLETFPALIRRTDLDGLCDSVNRTWKEFTGRDNATEQGEGWLAGMHADDRGVVTLSADCEYRLMAADGEYRWIHQTTRPLLDLDGKPSGFLSACFDVTDARQVQEKLQRSNEELEQFAYVASHDLREPLRMISSYIALIERRLGEGCAPELREFLGFAKDGASRMDRLVLDLLQLSRIGRMSSPKRMIPSGEALQRAILQLSVALEERGGAVEVGDMPEVFASEDDMVRLFQNLIGNAVKYAIPGTPPRITVTADREAGAWRFSVTDNGIGIARENFDRVFRIFQRLHGRDEFSGGSGIGLAICKKIVEGHDGRIWVDSAGANQGTSFIFTLPAHVQRAETGKA